MFPLVLAGIFRVVLVPEIVGKVPEFSLSVHETVQPLKVYPLRLGFDIVKVCALVLGVYSSG